MARQKDQTVRYPQPCEHGNEFRSILGAIPGMIICDPGCVNPKTRKPRPHRVRG